MKTNQIMIRENKAFSQRTKDGFFNANVLLNSWNEKKKGKPLQMGNYKKNNSTIDFITQLQKEGVSYPVISGRGKTGTWMHPKLFIDFAMWVSVEFKSIVIDYVLDGLIKSRHDAGDYYNQMTASILKNHIKKHNKKPNPKIYIIEAKRIKKLLKIQNTQRNDLSKETLQKITQMQKLNTMLLDTGVKRFKRISLLKIQAKFLLAY